MFRRPGKRLVKDVDQFLLSELFFPSAVIKFEVLHDACNTSDYDPILLQLDVAIARCNHSIHNTSSRQRCQNV